MLKLKSSSVHSSLAQRLSYECTFQVGKTLYAHTQALLKYIISSIYYVELSDTVSFPWVNAELSR